MQKDQFNSPAKKVTTQTILSNNMHLSMLNRQGEKMNK